MKNVELNCLKVSIPEAVLRRLLWANQLCAADLNCLDWPSKHTLRRLCLESCLGASDPVSQRRPGHAGPMPTPGEHQPGPLLALRGRLQAVFRTRIGSGEYCGET